MANDISVFGKWIKNIEFDVEICMEDFQLSEKFKVVADVVEDTSTTRQTVIQFVPTISKQEWKKRVEWIYVFTVDNRIVKIGGTRTGLEGRCQSYLCGHHIPERGKSRDMSKTNAFVYNTFDDLLRKGHRIQMWGYEIPIVEVEVEVWGETKRVTAQVYQAYETSAIELYKSQTSHYPVLNDNCDPTHRSKKPKSSSRPAKK